MRHIISCHRQHKWCPHHSHSHPLPMIKSGGTAATYRKCRGRRLQYIKHMPVRLLSGSHALRRWSPCHLTCPTCCHPNPNARPGSLARMKNPQSAYASVQCSGPSTLCMCRLLALQSCCPAKPGLHLAGGAPCGAPKRGCGCARVVCPPSLSRGQPPTLDSLQLRQRQRTARNALVPADQICLRLDFPVLLAGAVYHRHCSRTYSPCTGPP